MLDINPSVKLLYISFHYLSKENERVKGLKNKVESGKNACRIFATGECAGES